MKWGGWTNSALRRWLLAGVLMELVGLTMHFVGGRPWDVPWLLLTIGAAAVFVVGFYRHQPQR